MRYSRFVYGGATTQPRAPNEITVEDDLDRARRWQNHLRTGRQWELRNVDLNEPREWYRDPQGNWVQRTEDELAEAHARWEFNIINMRHNDWNDRRDPMTDIGYVHDIHQQFGLDVIMHIPQITFTRANFGSRAEIAANDWANDIFTEIRLEPGPHFVDLNSSGEYHTPVSYTHLTLPTIYSV